MKQLYIILLFLILLINVGHAQTPFEKYLPSDWKIRRASTDSKENVDRISKNTGCKITSIEYYLSYEPGVSLNINVYKAADEKEAQKLYNYFYDTGLKREGELFHENDIVYRFIGDQGILYKCRSYFREKREIKVWNIEMDLVPIRIAEDSVITKLQSTLYKYEIKNHDPAYITEINKLRSTFVFGNEFSLNNKVYDNIKPEYIFDTGFNEKTKNDIITFTFTEIKKELDIPKVKVTAKIPVKEFSDYLPEYRIDRSGLTFPNDFWPSDDPVVVSLVKNITDDCSNEIEKLTAIHKWVYTQIRFSDKKTGTRYGALNVINDRKGNLWDSADVLTTLCRCADLPAREIAGWIEGTTKYRNFSVAQEEGSQYQCIAYSNANDHIWTEVYITGKGWISIDPTLKYTGVPYEYIPFFIIEDGRMPATYWNIPTVTEKK